MHKIAVVDTKVQNLHGSYIDTFNFDHIIDIEADETNKNINTIIKLWDELAEININRNDTIYAIGGGVIGDMVAFVASTFKRGCPLIQVPTTLLAMVDSSLGGKTGFDTKYGKNLIGTFYQPQDIIVNIDFLATLDNRQIKTGLAESIKYYFIDPKFNYNFDNYKSKYNDLVKNSVDSKQRFIEGDEKDFGKRQFLNFGHTFGHALEQFTDYKKYTHGEAITKGMYLDVLLGIKLGITKPSVLEDLKQEFDMLELDYSIDFNPLDLIDIMKQDKKNDSEDLTFILLEDIGKPLIHKLSTPVILNLIQDLNPL